MGLVDDNAIEGAGRRAPGRVWLVEDAGDQRLDGRDLHLVLVFRQLLLQPRDLVDLGEVQHALDFGRFQGVARLLAERLAVDEEEDAAEALVLQEAIHQRNRRARLARPCRHGDQNVPLAGHHGIFDRRDRLLLIGAHPALAEAFLGEALGGGVDIGVELVQQVLRREPARHRNGMVGFPPDIPVPDAGFRQPLAHMRPTVRREDEGHAEGIIQAVFPGTMRIHLLRGQDNRASVAFGLLQGGRYIDALALRLDDADAGKAGEEGVVRPAAFRGPFGNGQVAALLRPSARLVGQELAVGPPAGIGKLDVDQTAGLALIQVQPARGLNTGLLELHLQLLRLGLGRLLQFHELARKCSLIGLHFDGGLLPDFAIGGRLPGELFGGGAGPSELLGRGMGSGQPFLGFPDLGAQRCKLRQRRLVNIGRGFWGHERPRPEIRIAPIGAAIPDAQGPTELERGQSLCGRARQAMGCLIAALAHGVEDVGNLPRQHLLSRKPSQQIMGRLARRRIIDAGERRNLLDHVLAELATLDQRGVRVFGEEALGQRTEAMQLWADLLQMTEIRRQCPTRCF